MHYVAHLIPIESGRIGDDHLVVFSHLQLIQRHEISIIRRLHGQELIENTVWQEDGLARIQPHGCGKDTLRGDHAIHRKVDTRPEISFQLLRISAEPCGADPKQVAESRPQARHQRLVGRIPEDAPNLVCPLGVGTKPGQEMMPQLIRHLHGLIDRPPLDIVRKRFPILLDIADYLQEITIKAAQAGRKVTLLQGIESMQMPGVHIPFRSHHLERRGKEARDEELVVHTLLGTISPASSAVRQRGKDALHERKRRVEPEQAPLLQQSVHIRLHVVRGQSRGPIGKRDTLGIAHRAG